VSTRLATIVSTASPAVLVLGVLSCSRKHDDMTKPPVKAPPESTAREATGKSAAPDAATADGIDLGLIARPTQLTMQTRSSFVVGVELTNRGASVIETQMSTGGCTLTVNGAESMAWNLAIGNGLRTTDSDRLEPGKTFSMSWPLGEDLFAAPGSYHLVLSVAGHQATADVVVTK
jgi:hypothetical protein